MIVASAAVAHPIVFHPEWIAFPVLAVLLLALYLLHRLGRK